MAAVIDVSKLISVFGFRVDEKSLKVAERKVKAFKEKLKGVEVRVGVKSAKEAVRQVKKTAEQTKKVKLDAERSFRKKESEMARKALRQRLNEFRQLKRAKSQAERDAIKARTRLFSGSARRTRSSTSDVISSVTGLNRDRGLGDMREFYRRQEIASAAKAETDAFRRKMNNLQERIRLNRGINKLELIRLDYSRNKLRAQNDLNKGLINQAQYEKRINDTINRRRELGRRARNVPSPGMGGRGRGGSSFGGIRHFMQGAMPELAAGGAAFGSVFAVREVFKGTSELESFESAMTAVLGTSEKARSELQFFIGTADRLNAPLTSGVNAYKDFVAAMVGSDISIEKTRAAYESLAKFGRVVGITQDNMNGSLRAFSQVASKGQLYREELQQQLSERLPGALSMVAKGLGVTTKKLNEMMAAGEVSAEMFFDAITKSMNAIADPGLAGAIGNLAGTWQHFINVFQKFVVFLRDAGSADIMKNIIVNLTDFVEGMMPVLTVLVISFGRALEFVTNILGTRAGGFIASMLLASFAIKGMITGLRALGIMIAGLTGLRTLAASLTIVGAAAGGGAAGVWAMVTAVAALVAKFVALSAFVAIPAFVANLGYGLVANEETGTQQVLQDVATKFGAREDFMGNVIKSIRGATGMDFIAGLFSDQKDAALNRGGGGGSGSTSNSIEININAPGGDPNAIKEATTQGVNDALSSQVRNSSMSTAGGFN